MLGQIHIHGFSDVFLDMCFEHARKTWTEFEVWAGSQVKGSSSGGEVLLLGTSGAGLR